MGPNGLRPWPLPPEMVLKAKEPLKESAREGIQGQDESPQLVGRQADRKAKWIAIERFWPERSSVRTSSGFGRQQQPRRRLDGWRCRTPGLWQGIDRFDLPFSQGWGGVSRTSGHRLPRVLAKGACEGVQTPAAGRWPGLAGLLAACSRNQAGRAHRRHGDDQRGLKAWQCCLDPDGAGRDQVPAQVVPVPQQARRGSGPEGKKGGGTAASAEFCDPEQWPRTRRTRPAASSVQDQAGQWRLLRRRKGSLEETTLNRENLGRRRRHESVPIANVSGFRAASHPNQVGNERNRRERGAGETAAAGSHEDHGDQLMCPGKSKGEAQAQSSRRRRAASRVTRTKHKGP